MRDQQRSRTMIVPKISPKKVATKYCKKEIERCKVSGVSHDMVLALGGNRDA